MDTGHTGTADPVDTKRLRILEGAVKVFLAYGFARTTMDDIARAAEMSRPALYLVFRNKSDIYRALAEMFLEKSLGEVERALAAKGFFHERLTSAVMQGVIGKLKAVMQSPHGAEILDMKGRLAGDLAAGWHRDFTRLVARAIRREAESRGVDLAGRGLSSELLANMLFDGLEGVKSRIADPDEQEKAVAGLVRVIDLSLQA